jgi:probable rRNA maturation factor
MEPPGHRVLVTIEEPFEDKVSAPWLEGIAALALAAESVPPAELGIVITDDATVQRLNREYAGEDKPTDVLSFSLREGDDFISPDDAASPLGEVIISYDTAERQAREAARPVEDELAMLLVHGILHLLGYGHAGPEEERAMFARQRALLDSLD